MATVRLANDFPFDLEIVLTYDEAESLRDVIFPCPCIRLDYVYHDLNCLLSTMGDGITHVALGVTYEQADALMEAIAADAEGVSDDIFWGLAAFLKDEDPVELCECDGCDPEDDDEGDDGGGLAQVIDIRPYLNN